MAAQGNKVTMGNLFSGSGAWELAAQLVGIEPVFEAEIEPFGVALEAKRFPNCIQLGDVSKINGADIPSVDILTNSSPCQGLSVAGRRAGLEDERSGLFMEAIRITKEMRNADKLRMRGADVPIRPRLWLWENVPGALSSAGGRDFQSVLKAVIGIVQEECPDIPMPTNDVWHNFGIMDGDHWQLAWRIIDAQYELPQRRRRLYLVADFGGHCAGQILFEREGLSWDFKEIAEAWEDTSRSFGERISLASRIISGDVCREEEGMERSLSRE